MNLAVSPAAEAPRAAAWVEGFLRGSGEVLYYDDALFDIFDGWLADLAPEAFTSLLPMLRRTFGTFEAPLRRNLGERVRKQGSTAPASRPAAAAVDLDGARAATVLPLIARLLGLQGESSS